MKRTLLTLMAVAMVVLMQAVPARRIEKSVTLNDGSQVTVKLTGDEFGHYWMDANGECYTPSENGKTFSRVEKKVAAAKMQKAATRRTETNERRKASGVNTPPSGLLLLVNFKDKSFQTENSQSAMNEMLNGSSYSYHNSIGSAKQYFYDQSNGQYNPTFDVVGPITLPSNMSYYGSNDSSNSDTYPGTMVWQACSIADKNYSVDFSKYDNDGDGYVDFVFVIYAGFGEADGGDETTIWPHAWDMASAAKYEGFTMTKLDGKTLGSYACTSELNYWDSSHGVDGYSLTKPLRAGIGTFCHEFSHVMGLPDYYDTNYGDNYDNYLTPGNWNLMDGGSYNESGEIPPCYMAHDKYYVGWATPTIMNKAENVTLPCDGQTYRYVTSDGTTATATTASTVYYFENRQQSGWDKGIPGHGMIVTKVTYNSSKWTNNTPNNTSGNLCYQVVAADGTYTYSSSTDLQGDGGDPFPGTSKVTSYSPYTNYPLTEIAENSGVITFKFMGGLNPYTVTFDAGANGTCATTALTESADGSGVTLPSATANSGYTFVGWATSATAITADAGVAGATYYPTKDLTLYAIYDHEGYVKLNYNLTGVTKTSGNDAGELAQYTAINATFTAASNYKELSEETCNVVVKVASAEITGCYSFSGGVLTISLTAAQVTGNVEITITASSDQMTIAEFLALADEDNEYQLTGVVKNISNTTYGNFDLTDDSGSIYIYGLLTAEGTSKQFASMNIGELDTLTLKGVYTTYNGTEEIANAIYVSHRKYIEPGGSETDSVGGAKTYTKVTSAPTDWAGEYLIVYETGNLIFDGSLTGLDVSNNTQSVTISNNKITIDSKYSFIIAAVSGGYSIKSASGYYIGATAASANEMKTSTSTVYVNSDIDMSGTNVDIVASGGHYLRYNKSSGQERFRYFKSSSYTSQQAIQLYKYTPTEDSSALKNVEENNGMKVIGGEGEIRLENLPQACEVRIVNMAGQVMEMEQNVQGNATYHLNKGIYAVQIVSKEGANTVKVVIR